MRVEPVTTTWPVPAKPRPTGALRAPVVVVAIFAVGGCPLALADERPTAAMLEPVQALVAFMVALPAGRHPTMFARSGVTIVENFPPFIFAGKDAVPRWEVGFRSHAAGRLTDLAARFGPAQDFDLAASRAYFVLPTTWTGRAAGNPFKEFGAWAFVLERAGTEWKILGYGWGVTASSEQSP